MNRIQKLKATTALTAMALTTATSLALGTAPVGAETPASEPATPAASTVTAPTGNPTQLVAAVTQPSMTFITAEWTVYLNDGTEWLNDGLPYTATFTCSGFVVDPSGYIVTAGHCFDERDAVDVAVDLAVAQYSGEYIRGTGEVLSDAELFSWARSNWQVEGLADGSRPDLDVRVWLADEVGGNVQPARIIEMSPLENGTDVALIKIEATDLPALELATGTLQVGDPIITVGYPGSTEDVTDAQSGASFMPGTITSVRTRDRGLLPVYEVGTSMTQGMSGGPTVDISGRVIGLNSFGAHGESADISFVQPASLIREMLNRHGVAGPSALDTLYRASLESFFVGDFEAAVAGLETVVAARPGHTLAVDYRNRATAELATQEAAATDGPDSAEHVTEETDAGVATTEAESAETKPMASTSAETSTEESDGLATRLRGLAWPLILMGVLATMMTTMVVLITRIRRQVSAGPVEPNPWAQQPHPDFIQGVAPPQRPAQVPQYQ